MFAESSLTLYLREYLFKQLEGAIPCHTLRTMYSAPLAQPLCDMFFTQTLARTFLMETTTRKTTDNPAAPPPTCSNSSRYFSFCLSVFSSSEVLGSITSIRSKQPTAACWSREEKRGDCVANLLRTVLKISHSFYSKRVRVFENKTLTTVSNP